MRAEDGRIVLMDFGTGRELEDDAASDLAGTPLYLAPEVLQGQQATVRSDIYSLGVLLYHLVTGSYPVHARTLREVRRAHERGERTAVRTARRDVPPKLARVIERAIDPRPEQRYESADALGADLAALKPRPRIVRLAYAAGMAAASILVAGAGWEVVGRQVGSSRTPSALLAGFAGLHSVGAANVSPVERPVIAVLRLKNLSAESDSDYLVDGLTDEIIRNLAVIRRAGGSVADILVRLQGQAPQPSRYRRAAWREPHRRRVDHAVGLEAANQRPTGPGRRGRSFVGRAVRSGAQGHLRHSGRNLPGDRQQARTDTRQRPAAVQHESGSVRAVPEGA